MIPCDVSFLEGFVFGVVAIPAMRVTARILDLIGHFIADKIQACMGGDLEQGAEGAGGAAV